MPTSTPATRIAPTADQLHAAWLVRRRPGWPPTLDEALAMPLYAALLRMHVVHTLLGQRHQASHPPASASSNGPAPPPWWRRSAQRAGVDGKRAAAGDTDD